MNLTAPTRASAAAAVLIAGTASPVFALSLWGKDEPPPPIGAVIGEVSGDAQFKKADAAEWAPAKVQTPLDPGDTVKTGENSHAVLLFLDGSKLRLDGFSEFSLEAQKAKKVDVYVAIGKLQYWIKKTGRRYKVRTPSAVAAIRGTAGQAIVDANGAATWDLFTGIQDVSDKFGNSVTMDNRAGDGGIRLEAKADTGVQGQAVVATPAEVRMEKEPDLKVDAKGEVQKEAPKEEEKKEEEKKEDEKKEEKEEPKEEPAPGEEPAPTLEPAPTPTTTETGSSTGYDPLNTCQASVSASDPNACPQ